MGLTTACKNCSLHPLCLPLALSVDQMDSLDAIIKRGRPLQKGEHLFYQGDEFKSVYAVRTGTIKTYTLTNDGEEQITGFHLASELVGLESYDSINHPSSAKALETTNVCEIPVDRLDELAGKMPELRRQLMRLMSKELRGEQQMMLLLSKKSAEERIASFLINLAARFKRRGFSGTSYRLTMSRADIANYLGLAVETVSRVFTRFQKQNLLEATGSAKDIVIGNFVELTSMASLAECERIELGLD
ncbi:MULTISPECIES: fumarate/nitrate reduction transcriptional regulator Fnr [Reinekea]|uniref:Transcriptional regulator, Crp/Fnr family n=1 Tax=Reinekea forsetii TaxID=1336806 RepID=A0A2K8KQM9_9GAMM|nr:MULTISPECIES: fumarate/nitrate reduction transcriptional regulator Fnr [Reinekea]ATX76161.1 transcriptional regulator, Crp/Fnr family [Reinekea forsetii]MDO7643825.1 fumarate/nitrate reduction transcriptional regulator Fnr [Reinekea forsetii]